MNDAIEYLVSGVFVVSLLFPLFWARVKRVSNPVLFISAAYGLEVVVNACFIGMALPIWVLIIYMIPQLETNGISLHWITSPMIFVGQKWLFLSAPIRIVITLLLYRSYQNIFNHENET